jgi:hypothetical protein
MEENQATPVLIVNGIEHILDRVQLMVKSSQTVEAPVAEIAAPDYIHFAAKMIPEQPELDKQQVAFYKHNNLYLVVFGKDKVLAAIEKGQMFVKGKLLSKHALKRCRVIDETEEAPAPTPAPKSFTKSYASDFKNTPRDSGGA